MILPPGNMTKPRRNIATCLDLPRRIRRRCANWASFISTKDKFCRPISLLKKSSELQPDDPEIQLKLGLSFLSRSVSIRKRATPPCRSWRNSRGNEQALLLLVDASRTPDDMEDARKLVQSLREKDQDRARYHLALGALDLRQNDQARAESEFKAALNLDSKSSEAYAALGHLYTGAATISKKRTKLSKLPPISPHCDLRCGYDMRIF